MGRLSKDEKARRAASAPPAGGAVEAPAVNSQVRQMTGHTSEEEMVASLPTNTNDASGEGEERTRKPRKPRTPKEAVPAVDPLLNDKQYQRAIRKATFLGAPKGVKGGFKIAAKVADNPDIALDTAEEEDVDDFFYALSKRRAVFDPFATWWSSALYFVVLLATLIGTRFAEAQGASLQKEIAKWFGYEKKLPEEVVEEGK